MRLSLMTVFLPRENIFFIEEWLNYHIVLGVDHFYLYNNAGSRWMDWSNNLEVTEKNKRGEPIYGLLAHKTDQQIQDELNEALEPYKKAGYVTEIEWRPRDDTGEITMDQHHAYIDYTKNYSKENTWNCFTDMDEFILPLQHETIPDLLHELDEQGYTYVVLPLKSFRTRFDEESCRPAKEVLKLVQCHDWVTVVFGRKSIVKCNILTVPDSYDLNIVHAPPVTEEMKQAILDPDLIRFNHYNLNQSQMDWVRTITEHEMELDSTDEFILKYREAVRQFAPHIGRT